MLNTMLILVNHILNAKKHYVFKNQPFIFVIEIERLSLI